MIVCFLVSSPLEADCASRAGVSSFHLCVPNTPHGTHRGVQYTPGKISDERLFYLKSPTCSSVGDFLMKLSNFHTVGFQRS